VGTLCGARERELFEPFLDHIRYPKIDPSLLRDKVAASQLVPPKYLMEALLHHAAPRQQIDSGGNEGRSGSPPPSQLCVLCAVCCVARVVLCCLRVVL
jgi:hypothetical protein